MKSQMSDSAFSLVLGWWGFPWGLVITPVQIGRNVFGMMRAPDPMKPSAKLEKAVRMNIAAKAMSSQAQSAVAGTAEIDLLLI